MCRYVTLQIVTALIQTALLRNSTVLLQVWTQPVSEKPCMSTAALLMDLDFLWPHRTHWLLPDGAMECHSDTPVHFCPNLLHHLFLFPNLFILVVLAILITYFIKCDINN